VVFGVDPQFVSSGGATYTYEGADAGVGECQTCLQFYAASDASLGAGIFRYYLARVYELNQNGQECCDTGGSSCPYNVGCNDHEMYEFRNFFTQVVSAAPTQSVTFSGSVEAPGDSQDESCVPATAYGICVPFTFTNTFIPTQTQLSMANGNLTLEGESMQAHVLISNWPFDPSSIGLRLKLLLMCQDIYIESFFLQPGSVDATEFADGSQFNTFTGVTAQDKKSRLGSISMATYALLNGTTPVKVNISGLYSHEYLKSAKYIYVDIPRAATVEYNVNVFLPKISKVDTGIESIDSASGSFVKQNKLYFIIGASVIGGLAICACIVAIVIKLR